MEHASLNTLPGEGECIPDASLHSRSLLPAKSNTSAGRPHINKVRGGAHYMLADRRDTQEGNWL